MEIEKSLKNVSLFHVYYNNLILPVTADVKAVQSFWSHELR